MARLRLGYGALLMGALLATPGCLFPDYQVTEDAASGGAGGKAGSGGSGGSSGTSGTSGTGGVSGSGGTVCDAPCPSGEDCGNGVDDDGDDAVDCSDEDCLTDAGCAGTCATMEVLPCGAVVTGQRTDGTGSTDRIGPPSYGCTTTNYEGPERAYRIDAEPGQYVFVEAYNLDADGALFLTDVVDGAACRADFACTEGSDQTGTLSEMVTALGATARDYYAIVDSQAPISYSLTVQCSPSTGCRPAGVISPGQSIDGTLAVGQPNVSQMFTTYSCNDTYHGGPEIAYMFTAPAPGSYRVDLTNLTGNLSLIVVAGGCGTTCATSSSWSIEPITNPESVTLDATADQTFYFVIDSFTIGSYGYTISVTAL